MAKDVANLGLYRFVRKTRHYFVYQPEVGVEGTTPPLYVPRTRLGADSSPPEIIQCHVTWGAT